jgi:hypothetical protein
MKSTGYTPRPGSKVALATAALLDGPMTTAQLGKAMECDGNAVDAMLSAARKNGFVIKLKDETGLLHFGLGGMVVDERFTPYERDGGGTSRNALGRPLTDAPLRRSVSSPEMPSAHAIAFANVFGHRKLEGEGKDSPEGASKDKSAESSDKLKQVPVAAAAAPSVPAFTNGHQLAAEVLDEARSQVCEIAKDASDCEPEFACAIWSDGDLQMVRDGETVAILSPAELLKVRKYLERTPSL